MNKEVVKHIQSCVSHIENVVGEMIFNGGNGSDIVELLNRALEIGQVSLMYRDELSIEELNTVESVLAFVGNITKPELAGSIEKNMTSASQVISKVEDLYREKKLMLGHKNDREVKCA